MYAVVLSAFFLSAPSPLFSHFTYYFTKRQRKTHQKNSLLCGIVRVWGSEHVFYTQVQLLLWIVSLYWGEELREIKGK